MLYYYDQVLCTAILHLLTTHTHVFVSSYTRKPTSFVPSIEAHEPLTKSMLWSVYYVLQSWHPVTKSIIVTRFKPLSYDVIIRLVLCGIEKILIHIFFPPWQYDKNVATAIRRRKETVSKNDFKEHSPVSRTNGLWHRTLFVLFFFFFIEKHRLLISTVHAVDNAFTLLVIYPTNAVVGRYPNRVLYNVYLYTVLLRLQTDNVGECM